MSKLIIELILELLRKGLKGSLILLLLSGSVARAESPSECVTREEFEAMDRKFVDAINGLRKDTSAVASATLDAVKDINKDLAHHRKAITGILESLTGKSMEQIRKERGNE